MQDMRGKVKRSVRVLRLDAPPEARLDVGATLVQANGTIVGTVTSVAFSARASAWLVMAKLQLDSLDGELWCQSPAGRFSARGADPI